MSESNDNKTPEKTSPLIELVMVKPDGTMMKGVSQFEAPEGSQQAAVVCLYSVDLPMPPEAEADSQVIAEQCVRMVPHPIMGQVATFAVSMDVALVALETAKALKTRDERIEALEKRIRQLESGSN